MEVKKKTNQNLMKAIKAVHNIVDNENIDKYRQSQDSFGVIMGSSKDINYEEVNIRGVPAEWVSVNRTHLKKYMILYFHGGGYKTGSFKYARTMTSKLAAGTSMDVLCFDYRLAPEHPYPAALEDAMKVWDYLMHQGYGSKDIIVAGDSAGGNLCLALTLQLKEEKRMLPKALVCISPWTDLTSSGKSYDTRKDIDPVLSKGYLDTAVSDYAPSKDLMDPLISPLFGDFNGFPPTYIQVGDNEILLYDSINLYRKMLKDNVYAKLDIYKGMWHVFQMSPFKKAYDAMDKIAEFIFEICI